MEKGSTIVKQERIWRCLGSGREDRRILLCQDKFSYRAVVYLHWRFIVFVTDVELASVTASNSLENGLNYCLRLITFPDIYRPIEPKTECGKVMTYKRRITRCLMTC